MITGMYKNIACKRLNSSITGARPVDNARSRQLIEKTFQRFCTIHDYWNVKIYCRSKIKLSNDWSVVGRTILFSC